MAFPSPIAVVGMSCRFPGAGSPEELKELLLNGNSGWGPIPSDRWNSDAFYNRHLGTPESLVAKNGYFLRDDISKFDARFFQVPPKEAQAMDPQQRILLQTTYEALENAGMPLEDIRGSKTAVLISSFAYDYQRMGYKDLAEVSGSHVAGTGMAMLSNRISYAFDLRGPSLTLDTGCVSPPLHALFLLSLSGLATVDRVRSRDSVGCDRGVIFERHPCHKKSADHVRTLWRHLVGKFGLPSPSLPEFAPRRIGNGHRWWITTTNRSCSICQYECHRVRYY